MDSLAHPTRHGGDLTPNEDSPTTLYRKYRKYREFENRENPESWPPADGAAGITGNTANPRRGWSGGDHQGRGELADRLDHGHGDQLAGLAVLLADGDVFHEFEPAERALGLQLDDVGGDGGVSHDHHARAVEAE